jgi:hypothetical protein
MAAITVRRFQRATTVPVYLEKQLLDEAQWVDDAGVLEWAAPAMLDAIDITQDSG